MWTEITFKTKDGPKQIFFNLSRSEFRGANKPIHTKATQMNSGRLVLQDPNQGVEKEGVREGKSVLLSPRSALGEHALPLLYHNTAPSICV